MERSYEEELWGVGVVVVRGGEGVRGGGGVRGGVVRGGGEELGEEE